MSEKDNIFSYSADELYQELIVGNVKKYRVKQLLDWLYRKYENNPDKMTNLSKEYRESLKDRFDFYLPKIVNEAHSKDGSTKYLLQLSDKSKIEMVLMPSEEKITLCISSQVGCARDCLFCATGKLGLKRNLTVAEIIGQVILAQRKCNPKKLSNIVFMGMGEPLDNYDNLIKSLKILADTDTIGFSPRRTTVSTCGVVNRIKDLADSGIKAKLAVSLNAAINSKRDILMPINKRFNLEELKEALQYYLNKSTFRVTFEYVLIKNYNMAREDIKALIKFTGDLSCKINLIKWNRIDGLPYESPKNIEVDRFKTAIMRVNKAVTLRNSRGDDIAAACGQLARTNYEEKL